MNSDAHLPKVLFGNVQRKRLSTIIHFSASEKPEMKVADDEVQYCREKQFSWDDVQKLKIFDVRHLFFASPKCDLYISCGGQKGLI